jgi:hypothetical protein
VPEPSSPILAGFEDSEVTYAKDQNPYSPLPALKSTSGVVLSRWALTEDERIAIASGADIFLFCHTFNQPMMPLRLEVGECDRDFGEMARQLGLST